MSTLKRENRIEEIMGEQYAIHYRNESFGKSIIIMAKNGLSYFRLYWYNDDEMSIYLEGLSVSYQRSGIGTFLLECSEKIAIALGCKQLFLWVKKETWIYDWYIRKGYEDYGKYEEENAVWMKKKLFKK